MSNNMTMQSKPPSIVPRPAQRLVQPRALFAPVAEVAALPSFKARRSRVWLKWLARLLIIVLPVALAAWYALAIAPQMYVSEARFAIRGSETPSGGGLGGLLGAAGAGLLDGYAVRDYLQSTDALDALEGSIGYTRLQSGKTDDWLQQLASDASREDKLAFYRRNVSVYYGLTEQVVTVKSFAFSPGDAQMVTAKLVNLAEDFANEGNKRAREDTLKLALEEVAIGEKRLTDTRLAVNAWRQQNQNIDPTQNISMVQTIIAGLEGKLAEARAEMAEISTELGTESQRRKQLAARIKALEEQIALQNVKLVNPTDSSASKLLLEYERLQIQVEFATKQLIGAQEAVDEARLNATKQQKYVRQIVGATLPQTPAFPNPFYLVLAVLAASLVCYGIFALFAAMARETQI